MTEAEQFKGLMNQNWVLYSYEWRQYLKNLLCQEFPTSFSHNDIIQDIALIKDTQTLLALVNEGVGLSFLQEHVCRPLIDAGEIYPILLNKEMPKIPYFLIWKDGRLNSSMYHEFYCLLREINYFDK